MGRDSCDGPCILYGLSLDHFLFHPSVEGREVGSGSKPKGSRVTDNFKINDPEVGTFYVKSLRTTRTPRHKSYSRVLLRLKRTNGDL